MNIIQMLEKNAREVPHKAAIVLGFQSLNYGELDETSNRVANTLIKLGLQKGDHAAILMPSTPEWVINYFGIIKAGGVAVPLNHTLTTPEYDSFLRDSDSKLLITQNSFSSKLSPIVHDIPLLKHVIEIDGDFYQKTVKNSPATPPNVEIDNDDIFIIIYTAGALGKQKGIMHTHNGLMPLVPVVSAGLELKRDDIFLCMIPFFYLFGLAAVLFLAISKGATVVVVPQVTPKNILETIAREKATLSVGVPAIFNTLAQLDDDTLKQYDLSSLRVVLTAGAKSSGRFMKTLEYKLKLNVCEIYALTEFPLITMGTVANHKLGTAGKPACEFKILDENGKEVSQGEIGEVICRAQWMNAGYYKMPDLTSQVIKDGWFHSGDLVRIDEEGYLEYIKKKAPVIVTSAGVKIPLLEVEEVLSKHPSIAEIAYVGVDDDYEVQIPTAFIVLKDRQAASAKEIREFGRQKLSKFKLPKRIEFVESIPNTSSGEIDRELLEKTKIIAEEDREC